MSTTTTTTAKLIAQRASLNPFAGQVSREGAAEYEALRTKMNEEARENWDNETWHRQVAQDLADTLDYGFTFDNLFSTYFHTKTIGEFDREVLRERRGLKVYYTSRGGYIDESQLQDQIWTLPRDTMGFHVSENIDKLRADFATKMEDLVTLASQRLEAEVNRRIFSLLGEAVPSGSPSYVGTTGLLKAELDAAIREVKDAIKPNGMGPVPVTIIGRASMVDKISDIVTDGTKFFDPEATAEVRAKGRIGVYRGANLVNVVNYTDEDSKSYIPANELWVFGGTVGEFVAYGNLQVKTWDENVVDYRHYRARKDVGGLVHHPEQARRIVDSSVAA